MSKRTTSRIHLPYHFPWRWAAGLLVTAIAVIIVAGPLIDFFIAVANNVKHYLPTSGK